MKKSLLSLAVVSSAYIAAQMLADIASLKIALLAGVSIDAGTFIYPLTFTLRDLVHAIPFFAIKAGLLSVEKKGKKNIFSGRILEIEGLGNLTVEQAFELSDASAERSAAGCTIELSQDSIAEYLRSNIVLLRSMIADGYGDARTLERRARRMEEWLEKPNLLRADPDAEYAAVIEIDLAAVVSHQSGSARFTRSAAKIEEVNNASPSARTDQPYFVCRLIIQGLDLTLCAHSFDTWRFSTTLD